MEGSDVVELLRRTRGGDLAARELLVSLVYGRMLELARRMLRAGGAAVRRWEQTDDLAQAAWIRIQRLLEDETVELLDDVHLLRMAARHVRFEMIDLYRKHVGPHGLAANHRTCPGGAVEEVADEHRRDAATGADDPSGLAAWGEFHELVERLPERDKELMDLLWYQGLPQRQTAELLGVDVKTVKRRWRDLKIRLAECLDVRLVHS